MYSIYLEKKNLQKQHLVLFPVPCFSFLPDIWPECRDEFYYAGYNVVRSILGDSNKFKVGDNRLWFSAFRSPLSDVSVVSPIP